MPLHRRTAALTTLACLLAACEPYAPGTYLVSRPPPAVEQAPPEPSGPQHRQSLSAASDEQLRVFLAATPSERPVGDPTVTGLMIEPVEPVDTSYQSCESANFAPPACGLIYPQQAIAYQRWQCAYEADKTTKVRACAELGRLMLRWGETKQHQRLGLRLLTLSCHLDVRTCELTTLGAVARAPVDALAMSKRRNEEGADWGGLTYLWVSEALAASEGRHFEIEAASGLGDGLGVGAQCTLWTTPTERRGRCTALLLCEHVLLRDHNPQPEGTGVLNCHGDTLSDTETTPTDGDPSLVVQDGRLEFRDEGRAGERSMVARERE